jgi:transcriptional regulator
MVLLATPGVQMLTTRDQRIVLERQRGDTIVEIARRHGISHQRVSVVTANATRFASRAYLDLMVARKTGEVVAYLVPFGPDYTLALAFSDWLIQELRSMGMEVGVETRGVHNGLIVFLSDTTPRRVS